MNNSKVISGGTRDPRAGGMFSKPNKSERASAWTVSCSNAGCPLLAAGQCIEMLILGPSCPYGKMTTRTGPTGRAGGYWKWLQDAKEELAGVPVLSSPPNKMAFIGDYVYLPYPHMDMCKAVPFLRHSCVFLSGSPFVPRGEWNIDTVLALVEFRPQSLMGGEITSYQKEHVPLFIQHLREQDGAMFQKLAAARPSLNVSPNYVGREAFLVTLKAGITIGGFHKDYPVVWEWDGSKLQTNSKHAYNSTWGKVSLSSFECEAIPEEGATVTVQDNSWVTESTRFAD